MTPKQPSPELLALFERKLKLAEKRFFESPEFAKIKADFEKSFETGTGPEGAVDGLERLIDDA